MSTLRPYKDALGPREGYDARYDPDDIELLLAMVIEVIEAVETEHLEIPRGNHTPTKAQRIAAAAFDKHKPDFALILHTYVPWAQALLKKGRSRGLTKYNDRMRVSTKAAEDFSKLVRRDLPFMHADDPLANPGHASCTGIAHRIPGPNRALIALYLPALIANLAAYGAGVLAQAQHDGLIDERSGTAVSDRAAQELNALWGPGAPIKHAMQAIAVCAPDDLVGDIDRADCITQHYLEISVNITDAADAKKLLDEDWQPVSDAAAREYLHVVQTIRTQGPMPPDKLAPEFRTRLDEKFGMESVLAMPCIQQ